MKYQAMQFHDQLRNVYLSSVLSTVIHHVVIGQYLATFAVTSNRRSVPLWLRFIIVLILVICMCSATCRIRFNIVNTAFVKAIKRQDFDSARIWLRRGADPNVRASTGVEATNLLLRLKEIWYGSKKSSGDVLRNNGHSNYALGLVFDCYDPDNQNMKGNPEALVVEMVSRGARVNETWMFGDSEEQIPMIKGPSAFGWSSAVKAMIAQLAKSSSNGKIDDRAWITASYWALENDNGALLEWVLPYGQRSTRCRAAVAEWVDLAKRQHKPIQIVNSLTKALDNF